LRVWRFVEDVTGDLRAGPVILLELIAAQFVLDGRDIIKADQPGAAGRQLADTLDERIRKRFDKVQPEHSSGGP
jgi:hypothetical protein